MSNSGQKILVSCISLLVASCGQKIHAKNADSQTLEAWSTFNDPSILEQNLEKNFFALPLEGESLKAPWSNDYWASYKGGISYRWNHPDYIALGKAKTEKHFNYALYTKSEIASLTPGELKRLSPAEKFDILTGDYSYPMVASERKRVNPEDEAWEGICHGWAPAAIFLDEPKPVAIKNADGIEIPFGSSDVKALISYYQGEIARSPSKFVGSRCSPKFKENPGAMSRSECRDSNAGSFHLALGNVVGMKKSSFVIDRTEDFEVWNQPLRSYKSEVVAIGGPSRNAAPGTVTEVLLRTTVVYITEVAPSWYTVVGTANQGDTPLYYQYSLELNAKNEIVGGQWLDKDLKPSLRAPRVDFFWMEDFVDFTTVSDVPATRQKDLAMLSELQRQKLKELAEASKNAQ